MLLGLDEVMCQVVVSYHMMLPMVSWEMERILGEAIEEEAT